MAKIVTVELLIDVETEAEAFDAVNEILRGQQRSYEPGSTLIDYLIDGDTEDYEMPVYKEGMFSEDRKEKA